MFLTLVLVWFVQGYQRIGFYAAKDIQPNEELTFDYGKRKPKSLSIAETLVIA